MSTSSLAAGASAKKLPFWDSKFAKRFAIVCCAIPGLLLIWDAVRHQLGVNSVNFAIRSTGLVGLVCLSLSLAITPIKRLTGAAMLIGIRRNLGVFGFLYIAAHFLIFFGLDRAASISSTLEEIVSRVYLWFGTGALVLMIPLALTSTDGMVTRLGPVWWKRLHRLAYVVVLCGLVHYYLLVKADTTRPFAFSVAFGALMLFRMVGHYVDLRKEVTAAKAKVAEVKKKAAAGGGAKKKFWSGELVIARIFDETHDVKTFRMVPIDGGVLPFDHVAGQYLNLALTIGGKRVNRSYTIASSPTRGNYVEISVKRSKHGSVHLHETWKEGDRVKVSAPAGKFHFAGGPDDAKRIVLVAGGVGITPCMSVIRSLTDRGWKGDLYLAYAVRTKQDIIFADELAYLQARFPNLHVAITLSQETAPGYAHGHLSKALFEELVPDFSGPVMMCGPEPMMVAIRALLVGELGIPNAQVHEEAFVSPPSSDDGAVVPDEPAEAAVDGAIEFKRSGKRTEAVSLTVLEAAEDCDVKIPFECRSGVCGQCKTKLVSGRVVMESQDALTKADREKGLILACQARPIRDVVVEA